MIMQIMREICYAVLVPIRITHIPRMKALPALPVGSAKFWDTHFSLNCEVPHTLDALPSACLAAWACWYARTGTRVCVCVCVCVCVSVSACVCVCEWVCTHVHQCAHI
jgi:hypothetical protein